MIAIFVLKGWWRTS
ncbi:trp operon leader peptide [Escherichia coli]|nr:trp operon leader peptide [Escherichia coli]EJB8599715.1 trp operon leader peptide [Escherichia coli]EJG7181478.1 trp operon leader peptide [Escherichia coli]EKI8677110.1 trp operon leader peptide [Escherichia coli]ELD5870315.1 trp operon leader peptide [Escherichia coli]